MTSQKYIQKFFDLKKEIFKSYNALKINKQNYRHVDYMANNSIVLEMISKYSRDGEFKKEVKQTRPETQSFINSVLQAYQTVDLGVRPLTDKEILEKK